MGYRGSQTAELVFEDCRVPVENRVGAENGGVAVVMSGLDLERAMIAPLCLGVAERALDLSLDYAKTRQQFGKPIGSFQMVQSMLADMYVLVETMRTFTYRTLAAASEMEIGEGGRGDIHKLTAASVMYAADSVHAVLDKAMQIHGGSGYIWETEINRLYRSTKLLEIGAGTTEVRKMIIAGELLKGCPRMSKSGEFGLDDETLATRATVYAADALAGKVVLVSGGAGGIGRGVAWLLARSAPMWWSQVAMQASSRRSSQAMAKRGLSASCQTVDIREPEQVGSLFERVWSEQGRLDVLINSAGGQFPQAAIDFSAKGWNAVINTNLNGTWHMMQAAARRWRDAKQPRQHRQYRRRRHSWSLWRRAHDRRAVRRRRPEPRGRGRMGAARHSRQLHRAGRHRDGGLEGLFARGARGLSALQSDDARRLGLGHRRGVRISWRAGGRLRDGGSADG